MIKLKNIYRSISVLSVTRIVMVVLVLLCLNYDSVLAQTTKKPTLEQDIEAKIKAGEGADAEKQHINADFLKYLLKTYSLKDKNPSATFYLQNAEIDGNLDFEQNTIASRVSLENCIFNGDVVFPENKFQEPLSLSGSTFNGTVNFSNMKVDGNFNLEKATFTHKEKLIYLNNMNVSGTLQFYGNVLEGPFTLSDSVMNGLECTDTKFENKGTQFIDNEGKMQALKVNADFYNIKVNGNASFTGSSFAGLADFTSAEIGKTLELSGARFTSSYRLDDAKYHRLNYDPPDKTLDLIEKSEFSHSAFNSLEAFYRAEGLETAANDVYISRKWREGARSGWSQYLLNRFLYFTVGYGKYPWFALIWSLLFIAIGWGVFWSEENMLIPSAEDKADFEGKYNRWWYSTALFLPIVDLGDAKIWTPKPPCEKCKWQWRRHYLRLHIIMGYLFIPIGLAAWTGLIK